MNYIMKIVTTRQEYGLLMKGVSETIKNEAKVQRDRFLGKLLGTFGTNLQGNAENVTYFHSFEVKHVPKEIRKSTGDKYVKINIYRIQAYDVWIFLYWIYRFRVKSLLEYTNLFSLDKYLKNDKIILKYL